MPRLTYYRPGFPFYTPSGGVKRWYKMGALGGNVLPGYGNYLCKATSLAFLKFLTM